MPGTSSVASNLQQCRSSIKQQPIKMKFRMPPAPLPRPTICHRLLDYAVDRGTALSPLPLLMHHTHQHQLLVVMAINLLTISSNWHVNLPHGSLFCFHCIEWIVFDGEVYIVSMAVMYKLSILFQSLCLRKKYIDVLVIWKQSTMSGCVRGSFAALSVFVLVVCLHMQHAFF